MLIDLQDQLLPLTASFNDAFQDKLIPNNADIDKGKTGFGITYAELHAKRHSIAVIPSVAIIEDKFQDYTDINCFIVIEGVTSDMVKEYLFSDVEYKKLLVTPESFGKIITAAGDKVQWLYDNFFCFLDESHSYATDAFREDILLPFECFFSFKNKAMGTATHFPYTDPRFSKLTKYKIRFKEKLGKITIIHDEKPRDVLKTMLTNPDMFPGNVHIFFNTVTQCGEAITATGIKDVNIFCRDDEKNMVNLGDANVHFKLRPVSNEYKKFNVYSCRYNEGWDLRDSENATIILVTDIGIPHSLIGIPFKGFQAVGRLRDQQPHKIYHITNSYNKSQVKSFDEIKNDCYNAATSHINYHNSFIEQCKQDGFDPMESSVALVKPFAKITEEGKAKIDHFKTCQVICAKWCNEHYNNIESIERTWQACNYDTNVVPFDVEPIKKYRKSKAAINEQVINQLEDLQANPDKYIYAQTNNLLSRLKDEYQILIQGYNLLGPAKLRELKYDDKQIKAALIDMSNNNAEAQLRILIAKTFTEERYTKKFIKDKGSVSRTVS